MIIKMFHQYNFSVGALNATPTTAQGSNLQDGVTVWMTLAYVVIFIFGFFGNACIIYIVATRKRMKSTFNFLIVNMAIGDFLVSLFIMPSEVSGFKDPIRLEPSFRQCY